MINNNTERDQGENEHLTKQMKQLEEEVDTQKHAKQHYTTIHHIGNWTVYFVYNITFSCRNESVFLALSLSLHFIECEILPHPLRIVKWFESFCTFFSRRI